MQAANVAKDKWQARACTRYIHYVSHADYVCARDFGTCLWSLTLSLSLLNAAGGPCL